MKQLASPWRAVALALLVTIAAFAIALPVSAQDSTATEIDSCTTITEPGDYVLTADIEDSDADSCILIEASDVTVRDLTVTDWGIGIYSYASERATVSGVTADSNFVGLFFKEGSKNTVTDTTAVNNEGNGFVERIEDLLWDIEARSHA